MEWSLGAFMFAFRGPAPLNKGCGIVACERAVLVQVGSVKWTTCRLRVLAGQQLGWPHRSLSPRRGRRMKTGISRFCQDDRSPQPQATRVWVSDEFLDQLKQLELRFSSLQSSETLQKSSGSDRTPVWRAWTAWMNEMRLAAANSYTLTSIKCASRVLLLFSKFASQSEQHMRLFRDMGVSVLVQEIVERSVLPATYLGVPECDKYTIAKIFTSLAKLDFRFSESAQSAPALEVAFIVYAYQNAERRMDARAWANCLWALAKLSKPAQWNRALVSAMGYLQVTTRDELIGLFTRELTRHIKTSATAQEVSNVLWALATLRWLPLYPELLISSHFRLRELALQGHALAEQCLANVLWSFATFKQSLDELNAAFAPSRTLAAERPSSPALLFPELVDSSNNASNVFKSNDSSSVFSLVKAGGVDEEPESTGVYSYSSDTINQALYDLDQCVIRDESFWKFLYSQFDLISARQLSSQGACHVMWAHVWLGLRCPPQNVYTKCFAACIHACSRTATSSDPKSRAGLTRLAQELSLILWSCVYLKISADAAFVRSVIQFFCRYASLFSPHSMALMVWAFTKLQVLSNPQTQATFMEAWFAQFVSRWDQFSAQALGNALWSLGTLRMTPSADVMRSLIAAIIRERVAVSQSPHNLSNIMWGLARINFRAPDSFIDAFARGMGAGTVRPRPKEIVSLMWAFGLMRVRVPSDAFEPLCISPMQDHALRWSPGDLVVLLHALAQQHDSEAMFPSRAVSADTQRPVLLEASGVDGYALDMNMESPADPRSILILASSSASSSSDEDEDADDLHVGTLPKTLALASARMQNSDQTGVEEPEPSVPTQISLTVRKGGALVHPVVIPDVRDLERQNELQVQFFTQWQARFLHSLRDTRSGCPNLTSKELGMVYTAMATHVSLLGLNLNAELVHALEAQLLERLGAFASSSPKDEPDTRTICAVLQACANMKQRPSWSVLGALDKVLDDAQLSKLDERSLVVVLKSYVQLQLRPDPVWMDMWVRIFAQHLSTNKATLTLALLSDALWALATVQYRPPRAFLQLWSSRFHARCTSIGRAEADRLLKRTRWAMRTFSLAVPSPVDFHSSGLY
ncbi:hypothetical protein FVE85_9704 [Porphyridium purpureum]|uniref:Tbc2 translation factor, chloroplastic n=1 Tax=Porphyridium purpureum TaxID=35688 RepID=A0A5J4YMM2_PORPP|nr:hypothetical protein FVE85_9704 [Porphyridium purpureum]|eukprot:POR7698..scf246_12